MKPELAVNAMLEIIFLRHRIDELDKTVKENCTWKMVTRPEQVTIQAHLIEAAVIQADYIGHKLTYKDVEIALCTRGMESCVNDSIWPRVFSEYQDKQ